MGIHQRITLLLISLWTTAAACAGSLSAVSDFGANPGNLRLLVYEPATLAVPAPLVVALHGCQQGAADYDDESGWTRFADRWGFLLLLPEQATANNTLRCFNWFRPGDTRRDQGEALSIRRMIAHVSARYPVDPQRLYVTGQSAGGAMTAALLAAYPDLFAAGAIIAGVPYGCAISDFGALWCQLWGWNLAPAEWGKRVRQAAADNAVTVTRWPRVAIWQGSADSWVRPGNATELMEQWTAVHGIDQQPEAEDTVSGYPHKTYADNAGNALVETYWITGMGHGLPIHPDGGDDRCGVPGPYMLPAGICASYHIARFFGLDKPGSPPR